MHTLASALLVLLLAFTEALAADFHVAVTGDDSNPGTASAPFATLPRARDAIRQRIASGLTQDLVVEIEGGTYRLTEPMVFGPEDSGTREHSITYRAVGATPVLLSGGRAIDGWKTTTEGRWTTEVPEVRAGRWYPRQLFINGQRAIRARTPNQGWCEGRAEQTIEHASTDQRIDIRINTTGGKGIFGHAREYEYDQATLPGGIVAWNHATDIELVSLRHNEGGRKALQSIDANKQTVMLRPMHRWAPKVYGNDWFNGVPAGRCYLENALEFIDSPGEWYLDRQTGLLTYWPRAGEDPARCEAIAPVVQQTLLSVAGTGERPVTNVHFEGLHVAHVDWQFPAEGYNGLFCCNVPVFRDGGDPGHTFIDGAVEMKHARSCSFRDGGIARVGAMGMVLREGTADIAVEGNHIEQTGAGGIGLGQCNVGFGYLKAAGEPEAGEYERFRVLNNHVHHCGLDYFGAVGIAIFRVKDSTIAHNLVHDTAYCGVVFPGDQDPNWNFSGGNRLEWNHIYRDMRVTQDGAGLYTSFAHRDTRMRGNLIHNSSGNPMSGGICLDGCTGVTFDHNVVYRNPVWSLVLFRPVDLAENTWRGNLVMPSREWGVSASRAKQLFDGRPGWELNPGQQDYAPPAEFIEAMSAYAGLESAYRERLEGTVGRRCELHVLDDGVTWQFDFPAEGRGVVYRLKANAGKGAETGDAASDASSSQSETPGEPTINVRLRGLDGGSRYQLKAYTGKIRPTPTDSSTGNFTSGPLFPMVHEVALAKEPAFPSTAAGVDLTDKGLPLPDSSTAAWVVYERER